MTEQYEAHCPICNEIIGTISSEEWLYRKMFCHRCKDWYKTTETRNVKIREVKQ